jgi:hypothetical protein
MLWSQVDVLEDQIRDLQRVIKADEAVLEIEKSSDKRLALVVEVGDLQYKVDRLREQIEALSRVD